jgi:chromosomal replication initiator protein
VEQTGSTIWVAACKKLKEVLSKDVYERWISVIEAKSVEDKTLTLQVANDFYQSWLVENYLPLIADAVTVVTGETYTIEFAVKRMEGASSAAPKPKAAPVSKSATPRKKRTPGTVLNPNYTFDAFIVGSSNNFAHAACLGVARSPARAYNPLFIYGGTGLGKTHLMQAIGNSLLSRQKDATICYLSCEIFINEYIDALQNSSLTAFRKKYRQADLLLIDDIQFLAGKERMQEEFFHTFNALFDQHKQIVLTCDRPASEIPGLEHRLVSRFEWGLVTELEPPDVETRIAILRHKQKEHQVQLPDDVLTYLAERIRSNVRRLEGALIRAASYVSLTGRTLTPESLEHLLRDTLDQEQQEKITIDSIQRAVADYYDVRLTDMTSKRRPASVALPRQVAMYLSREMTQHSYPMIGEAFGKNHATVLHACRTVQKRIAQDDQLRQSVSAIQQKMGRR